jgi:hypothetical protein
MDQRHYYSELITQDEFNIRYGHCKSRIALGYTQEEVSFLMGKHPYFYCEYEEMRDGVKLIDAEKAILSIIYKTPFNSPLDFANDDFGFNQKRLIKGVRTYDEGIFKYTLTHPWLIIIDSEKGIKNNLPITYKELPYRIEERCQLDALCQFRAIITDLLDNSFFQDPQLPIDIYQYIRLYHFDPILRPVFLKQIMYVFIAKRALQMKTIENKIHYHA